MNLPRLLNTLADSFFALRLAGFTPDEAQRIVTEAARDAVNRLPHRPYPAEPEPKGNDNAATERDVPEPMALDEGC